MANFLPAFINSPDDKTIAVRDSDKSLFGQLTFGAVYKANPIFDTNKDGVYTVGDVRNYFNNRLATWRRKRIPVASVEPQGVGPSNDNIIHDYDNLMNILVAAQGPVEKFVRRAIERDKLPSNNMLIVIGNENSLAIRARYARILACALREELGADVSVHHEDDGIELVCTVTGNKKTVLAAVSEFSDSISNRFANNIGIKINTRVFPDISSSLPIITSEFSENSFRRFAFEVMNNE